MLSLLSRGPTTYFTFLWDTSNRYNSKEAIFQLLLYNRNMTSLKYKEPNIADGAHR
jgi:hypothetical protein